MAAHYAIDYLDKGVHVSRETVNLVGEAIDFLVCLRGVCGQTSDHVQPVVDGLLLAVLKRIEPRETLVERILAGRHLRLSHGHLLKVGGHRVLMCGHRVLVRGVGCLLRQDELHGLFDVHGVILTHGNESIPPSHCTHPTAVGRLTLR